MFKKKSKSDTNGDKLRRMTNRELSRWLSSMERLALFTNSMTRPEGWEKWLETEIYDDVFSTDRF